MNIEKIKKANTNYLGKNIIYFPVITSTQDYSIQMDKSIIENGELVITDFQTKGRGTKDRKWSSSSGKNIMMTITLKPNIEIAKLEGLTIKIAEEISKAIFDLYGYKLTIKEPNDLLFNGRKICGILTQSTTLKNIVKYLYIGIGFNVNEEDFTNEIKEIATSLRKETGKEFEIEEIIVSILERLEGLIERLF